MGSIPNWMAVAIDPKPARIVDRSHARPIRAGLGLIPFWIHPVFSRVNGILVQSLPQSEFIALPLLWDTRGCSAI